MPRRTTNTLKAARTYHEHIMEPLADKRSSLEIALTYLRQVVKRVPDYEWSLNRAITEIEDAREGIELAQRRAVEYWRKNLS